MTEPQTLLLWVVPVAGVAGLVVAGYLVVRRQRRDDDRRAALFLGATARGWDYEGVDSAGLAHRWSVAPFGVGDDRRAGPVVSGTWGGRRFVSFDYSYSVELPRTEGAQDRRTLRFRVTALPLPGPLPALEIASERGLARARPSLPGDIDLESDAFNRRFRVRCPDRKTASDVLHPRTMEALLRHDPVGTIRAAGTDLLLVASGRHTATSVARDLEALTAVADGIPRFVWDRRG